MVSSNVEILKQLRNRVRPVLRNLCGGDEWMLHHGKSHVHWLVIVPEILLGNSITSPDNPPYAIDLAD